MRMFRFLALIFFFVSFGFCQTPSKPSPPTSDRPTDAVAKPDTHLSAAEAEELFKSLDDVMQFASQDSGLPIKSKIKRELGDRDQVVKYIQEKMEEDED